MTDKDSPPKSSPASGKSDHFRLLKNLSSKFRHLSIANKMLLGFFPLLLLLIVISTFSLIKLNHLNSMNNAILNVDIPVKENVDKMKEAILQQESYVKRYMLLKDQEMLRIFSDRGTEFINLLDKLKQLPADRNFHTDELQSLYNSYSSYLISGIKLRSDDPESSEKFERNIRMRQSEIGSLLDKIKADAERDQDEKAGVISSIGSLAFKFALILCVFGLALSITAALVVTRNIVSAVRKLQFATEMISQGKFDHRPDIDNKDELGELADAFVMMATRLMKLEEMYLDASPLTRLPGGVAVENILKKKIEQRDPLAFCLMDLDNFKSYNDHYGYAKGNDMILETASIIENVLAEHGGSDDFLGHIGGDDFVVITTPDKFKNICRAVIERFDHASPGFYNEADRNRGFISGENRQGQTMTFPLATISIAVATNQNRIFENHIQVGEIVAEIKEYAKSITGSSMIVDKRHDPLDTKVLSFRAGKK
ncbi:MAG: diguanylate cyclase [Proteobacteria bacterium]|nr:diguanylate cyclase [Pseudomonadota bacterium]MBU1737584.1 diguanylate cyclase [Pseudomonadota bacterium]